MYAEKIKSPKTGRDILVGGPTYEKLLRSPKWKEQLLKSPVKKVSSPKKKSSSKSKSHGCSNAGKYKNVSSELFCGPEGGSCYGTYPVNTKARARAALAYARHAPNPEGIRKCVKRISKEKGW